MAVFQLTAFLLTNETDNIQAMKPEITRRANIGLNLGIVVLVALTTLLLFNLIGRLSSPHPDSTRVYNPTGLLGEIIQVDVRNGCGESGLAGEMTDFLRSYGFDVVEHGDHTSFDVDSTLVIDRIGNLDAANQVALALGIPDVRIISDVRSDYYLDVSVIIGRDYASIRPFRTNIDTP